MHHDDREMLKALRTDLLRGDFSRLDAHLAALSDIESRVAEHRDSSALMATRVEAERNREILGAAAAGVRAALRRLGEAGAPASVYAPDGRRLTLDGPATGIESRA